MRSVPPLQIELTHYAQWRAMVAALALTAGATMAAWWWGQPRPVPPLTIGIAFVGVLFAQGCAVALWRVCPRVLRWERQRWHLSFAPEAGTGSSEQATGEIAVAIDLGGWMLLRFVPDSPPTGPQWIALQRRGLEAHWHLLRCALYAARPAPAETHPA